jgi:hypothetical protein
MMSLMQLRFAAAGTVCALAAIAGIALPPPAPSIAPNSQARALAALTGPSQADVEALVARLGATDFFPAARTVAALREGESGASSGEAASGQGNAADTAAPQSPPIRALVRREAEWRLYTAGQENLTDVFVPGEELFDGWVIVEISPRTLRLERDGDYQTIDVFLSNDTGPL